MRGPFGFAAGMPWGSRLLSCACLICKTLNLRWLLCYIPKRSMIFSKEYVGYLARHAVKHLIDTKMIRTNKPKVVEERVYNGLLEEMQLEDRINEEVRVILEAYQEDMRRSGASYPEMFKKVKQELAKKYKAVL
jgi:hypothetical protein